MAVGESVRVNIAECVATLTPIGATSEGPIQFGGEVAYHEAAFLGPITPKYERGQRFLSANAGNDVVMQTNSRAGTRPMTLLMGTDIDRLTSWAQRNPQQLFNLDFFYKLFTDTDNLARIQRHLRCFMPVIPTPTIAYDQPTIEIMLDFGDLIQINPVTGQPI